MRLLVYSHDTFGLGNIRRMLAICGHLRDRDPDSSILMLTGSPMAHDFRQTQGLEYIKLPCLRRDPKGRLGARYLSLTVEKTLALRKKIILDAAAAFEPEVFLVDKTPGGLSGELEPALEHLRVHVPFAKNVLLLRDILDTPMATREMWKRNRYHEILERYYDRVLIAGLPEIFDAPAEYGFSSNARRIARFSGYIGREPGPQTSDEIRRRIGAAPNDRIVTVTTGGGEDGYAILDNCLRAMREPYWPKTALTVMVTGPELDAAYKNALFAAARGMERVRMTEFSDDMMSLFGASDLVISMGGYNTTCEVLSLRKRAIVIPRTVPVEEQSIRAERMAKLGLFRMIPQPELTPARLALEAAQELAQAHLKPGVSIDMKGLDYIAADLERLAAFARRFSPALKAEEEVLEVA